LDLAIMSDIMLNQSIGVVRVHVVLEGWHVLNQVAHLIGYLGHVRDTSPLVLTCLMLKTLRKRSHIVG